MGLEIGRVDRLQRLADLPVQLARRPPRSPWYAASRISACAKRMWLDRARHVGDDARLSRLVEQLQHVPRDAR